jgi:glycosyltransferase involved in cell wall biosynthesis
MLHGVPVVASRAGALEELLADGAGVLVAPRSVEELAGATVALLSDPARRAEIGACAAERARAAYLWPQRMPQLTAAYRRFAAQIPRE